MCTQRVRVYACGGKRCRVSEALKCESMFVTLGTPFLYVNRYFRFILNGMGLLFDFRLSMDSL